MRHFRWIGGLALGLAVVAPARADLTIETKHQDHVIQTLVSGHKLSVQTPAADGSMIFRGDQKLLWMIDAERKTYREMTEKDVEALGSKLQDAMAKMKEALASVPQEQRAAVEKMMAGQMPATEAAKRIVTPLGQSRKINEFVCAGYRAQIEGEGELEIWSTDPKALEISASDLAVFNDFAAFMKALNPGGLESMEGLLKDFEHPKEGDVPGLPILTIMKDEEGKERWRSEVTRISHDAIPGSIFELPAGLEKEKFELGG